MRNQLLGGAVCLALSTLALPADARQPSGETESGGNITLSILNSDHPAFWSGLHGGRGIAEGEAYGETPRREHPRGQAARRAPRVASHGPVVVRGHGHDADQRAPGLASHEPSLAPGEPAITGTAPGVTSRGVTGFARGTGGAARACLTTAARALLERVESQFGPMQIVSTCRPGARIAGTGQISKHATGNAIDFNAGSRKGEVVRWLIANHKSGGIMTYAGMSHIHVDIGYPFVALNSGGRRR
jgi:hypothetical protein